MQSKIVLRAAASQYQQLTDFADFLSARNHYLRDPAKEAERFLRFEGDHTDAEWAEVIAFYEARNDPDTGKYPLPAQPPEGDAPQYLVSGVAMQFRLLFPFAAFHTIDAFRQTEVFLRDHHGYSHQEWEDVLAFLESQEENLA